MKDEARRLIISFIAEQHKISDLFKHNAEVQSQIRRNIEVLEWVLAPLNDNEAVLREAKRAIQSGRTIPIHIETIDYHLDIIRKLLSIVEGMKK